MPTELSNSIILKIHNGLSQLDGYERVVEEDGKTRIIREPYRFASEDLSWTIVINRRILATHVQNYIDAKDDLIRRISGGVEIDAKNLEQLNEFSQKVGNLLKKKVQVEGLLKIKHSDLNLKKNPIPRSVLEDIFDIVELPGQEIEH